MLDLHCYFPVLTVTNIAVHYYIFYYYNYFNITNFQGNNVTKKMEKNPISFLQEHMVSSERITPKYTLERSITGTHINSFVMKVTCGELNAEGTGASKKEAKINAALKLINKINIKTISSQSFLEPVNEPLDFPLNNNSNLQKSAGTNYIGKLQEFGVCRGVLPEYTITDVFGPAHLPVFTCICRYGNLQEKAKGNSKKEAKSMAAKQMYDRVLKEAAIIIPETKVKNYLKSAIKEEIFQPKVIKRNPIIKQENVSSPCVSESEVESSLESAIKEEMLQSKVIENNEIAKQDLTQEVVAQYPQMSKIKENDQISFVEKNKVVSSTERKPINLKTFSGGKTIQSSFQNEIEFLHFLHNINNKDLEKSSITGINYIGQLQEFGVRRGVVPEYYISEGFGPAHMPIFICICKYENLEEEAESNNKKKAKSLAAKKMFDRVSNEAVIIIPKTKVKSYLKSAIKEDIFQSKVIKNNPIIKQENVLSPCASESQNFVGFPDDIPQQVLVPQAVIR